jgi:Ca2+-transporting ATPase
MAIPCTPSMPAPPAARDSAALGLSQTEAAARLLRDGPNELQVAVRRGVAAIALEVMREPMFLLLLAAGGIYVLLGDLRDALVLLSSVLVIVVITVVQARKTERALDALRELASPRALVLRDGQAQRVAGREVVCGDVLLLREGDRVAADGRLLQSGELEVDESLLTGESVPVIKSTTSEQAARVFAGSLVVRGGATVLVDAIGMGTEVGRIGRQLRDISVEISPLQRETRRIVRLYAAIGLVLCLALVLLYGVKDGAWLKGILAGVTLAMAALPEEFPVVLTVFLALGAWRISRQRVLTRRVAAIETLGAAAILCVDKTGTLTQNRMALRSLVCDGVVVEIEADSPALPPGHRVLLRDAALASVALSFDPMDRALLEAAQHCFGTTPDGAMAETPPSLPSGLMARIQSWRFADGRVIDYVKGAPESIAALCALDSARRQLLAAELEPLAATGQRLLAVARRQHTEEQQDAAFEFIGLVAFVDPIRPEVPAAVSECRAAGIRVVMITGDHPVTALAIAREIGLHASAAITGAELRQLEPAALAAAGAVDVYARVSPEQKLDLVRALQARGAVVAMTGDGVNDAPALRAAHIGIAMGGRGTDVAREAADLVLLDDDFTSIVAAIRLGRRIYANIRNAMHYILAVHIPTAGLSFLPVLFGWPMLLFPVHVVFLEFVIDPACSIAFEAEPETPDNMHRPPRPHDAALFDRAAISEAVWRGGLLLALCAGTFGTALVCGEAESRARALAFATLVCGNVVLILANRGGELAALLRRPNPALWWLVSATMAGLIASIHIPGLNDLFRFAPLSPVQWLLAGVLSASLLLLWRWPLSGAPPAKAQA